MTYKCKHFQLHELVYPSIYRKYENKPDLLWQKFDERLLKDIDHLRDVFGKCVINDWNFGGKYKFCGCRPFDCIVGAELSDHKFWNAFDLHFEDYHANTVRKYILKHREELKAINTIEDGVSWVHVAHRNINTDLYGVLIIKP